MMFLLREEHENGSGAPEGWASAQDKESREVYSRRKRRGEVEAYWYLKSVTKGRKIY